MQLLDRTIDSLLSIVERALARTDYHALYSCVVIAQSGDLSRLDLRPDNARIPGLQGILLRLGLPGVTVAVAAGSRVLLGWEDGDPRKPFAALWSAGTVSQLNVSAGTIKFNGASTAVVSYGDTVTVGTQTGAITGPASAIRKVLA